MVQVDVLAGGVAAPGATADRRGHRHAVHHAAGVGLRLRLTDHHAADTGDHRHAVDVVVVKAEHADRVADAAYGVNGHDGVDGVLEFAAVFMDGEDGGELFHAPDAFGRVVVDAGAVRGDEEFAVFGDGEACGLGHVQGGEGDGVGQAVAFGVPHDIAHRLLFLRGHEVAADRDQFLDGGVPDAFVDDDVAVRRAAGAEVGGLGAHGVERGLVEILRGGFVPDHGGVAGAYRVGRGAGHVGAAHDALPAGGDDQVAFGHQGLGEAFVDLAFVADDLDEVFRGADAFEAFAHQFDGLAAGLEGARVRGEDDGVARLDGVDGVAGRGEVGVCGGDDAADDAHRFGVFDQPLLGDFFDDADRLLAQAVAQDAANLETLGFATDRVTKIALRDAQFDQFVESLGVGNHLRDRTDGPVNRGLIPALEGELCGVSTSESFLNLGYLLCSQFKFRITRGHVVLTAHQYTPLKKLK